MTQLHEFDFERKEVLKKVTEKEMLKIHEANRIVLHRSTSNPMQHTLFRHRFFTT